jgi:RecG-like helicase
MFNLHRKRLPLEVLKRKADDYVEEGLLSSDKARNMMSVIEQERSCVRTINEVSDDEAPTQRETMSTRLSHAEMASELHRREELLKAGENSGVTDQWRVYAHIVNSLRLGEPLRLMVQASAGTGKSFLLTTVYLWCLCHGKKAKACAPTGIAAANVEIEGRQIEQT